MTPTHIWLCGVVVKTPDWKSVGWGSSTGLFVFWKGKPSIISPLLNTKLEKCECTVNFRAPTVQLVKDSASTVWWRTWHRLCSQWEILPPRCDDALSSYTGLRLDRFSRTNLRAEVVAASKQIGPYYKSWKILFCNFVDRAIWGFQHSSSFWLMVNLLSWTESAKLFRTITGSD